MSIFRKLLNLSYLLAATQFVVVPASGQDTPMPGQAVEVGVNTLRSITPSESSAGSWNYAAIGCYGGGSFVPDYSEKGAYVLASIGGHGCPKANIEAAIFDFTDAQWKLLRNANGIPLNNSHADYTVAQTSGSPNYEILGASAGQIPAPSHTYQMISYLPSSLGGGPKGSFLKLGAAAITTASRTSGAIHRLDLATGLWTRPTNNRFSHVTPESSAVKDSATDRYYLLPNTYNVYKNLEYFDAKTNTIKSTPSYSPGGGGLGGYITAFLDPVRRLIIMQIGSNNHLRALDLNDFASGWRTLNISGTMPSQTNRWIHYPPDGNFYSRKTNDGNSLFRLTPPTGNWKKATWTIDKVTITGATLQDSGGTTQHYTRFFYVPALQSLAWIANDTSKVVIMSPPSTGDIDNLSPSAPTDLCLAN